MIVQCSHHGAHSKGYGFFLLFIVEEILVEAVVLEKTATDVLDDIHGYIAGETLEGTGFTVGITNTLHVVLKLFDILRKRELFG